MIPREILKNIGQIELRTNRIVSESEVEPRLCEPQHFRSVWRLENFDGVLSSVTVAVRRPTIRYGARASARCTVRTSAASKPNPTLSLALGFSQVIAGPMRHNRFSGFPATGKPLKRLEVICHIHTGLKPGANESGLAQATSPCVIRLFCPS
jgi:hypothetical protein